MSLAMNIFGFVAFVPWFGGTIWLAGRAFEVHVNWGFAVLCFPPMGFVFASKHWEKARVPFLVWVTGWVLLIARVATAIYLEFFQ